MKNRKSKVFIALCAAVITFSSQAEEDPLARDMEEVESITITGTRTDREINEIAANVTQISQARIDAMASSNLRDLLRYEPGVSVEGNGRFGFSGFNIRGINGDRVLILLDNVPIADSFSFGPNLNAGRDFVDIDLIESVDIVRGPASTLYGSDAIGGVVAFTSKSPNQLIEIGEDAYNRIKIGYDSQSNQQNISFVHAYEMKNWQWLINAGAREGEELKSFYTGDNREGSERRSANPQENESSNLFAKLIYSPTEAHRISLSADYRKTTAETILLSDRNTMVRGTINLDSLGNDEQTRKRALLNYRWQPKYSWIKRLDLDLYSQSSKTEQNSTFRRAPFSDISSTNSRVRDSLFEQESDGLNLQVDQEFEFYGEHYLIYGVQWQRTDSEGLREGSTIDDASGMQLPEFSPFPTRDFPLSELVESAFFVQDEYRLMDGKLVLSPGVRYDRFELTPTIDDIFTSANPGVEIVPFEDSQWSKKVGAVYKLTHSSTLWAQYSEGFRIPPMDDVNVGFTNFLGGYTSLANPNLKPESVKSMELGYRLETSAFNFSTSVYQNDYENFIESRAVLGFNRVTNLLEFQARNLDDVEINGVDAQVTWYVGESIAGADDWFVNVSASVQDSEDTTTGQELESVLPAQYVAGIQYKTLDDNWRIEASITHTEKANLVANTSDNDQDLFRAPSYTLVDLLGHYQISPSVRMNFAAYNIFDKKYWLASEVRGRSSEENLDRFSSPGRTFALNLVATF